MKAYRGVDGRIRLFRPDLNMARMNNTAQRVVLPNFDGEELTKCVKRLVAIDQEWVPHSTASSLYIRPTLIGTEVRSGTGMVKGSASGVQKIRSGSCMLFSMALISIICLIYG